MDTKSLFAINPGDVLSFADINKGMGFATKTVNTARTYGITDELQQIVAKYLPKNVRMENTNGTGFKSLLFRRFLELHNLDLLIDQIIDAYNHGRRINARVLGRKVKANLPDNFRYKRAMEPKARKVQELLEAVVLCQPLPDELQDVIEAERQRMMALYGEKISFYHRSAGSKGEDDNSDIYEHNDAATEQSAGGRLMKADTSISKVQLSKMGAGQHESFPEIKFRKAGQTTSSKESCVLAHHHVYASTYSYQAVCDYKGMRDKNGEWFHSGVNMDVIMMPIIHSHLGGSALGFSDVIDDISEITFGQKVMGDNLVGGAAEFPISNTRIMSDGSVKVNTIAGYLEPHIEGILKAIALSTAYIERMEAPEHEKVEKIGKLKKFATDTEWAYGPLVEDSDEFILSMVQYRNFLPAQHARNTDTQTVFERLDEKYKVLEIKPVATGTSVGEMCTVGPVLHIKNKRHLMEADVKGKILIVDQAFTELLGTVKQKCKGWIVIPKALKAHATLNGDGEICQLQGMDREKLRRIKDGTVVTILFNELFIGDLSNCYKEEKIDLSTITLPTLIKLGLVEGNTSASRRRKLFPYLRLNILHDNDLFRYEAAGWGAGVPGLFNWVMYNLIDETSLEGKAAKQYISDAMKTYNTADPIEAYIQRMAGVMFPLCAASEYFGKACHIRMYGARLEEDPAYVTYHFPHEPNPIIGFNGAAMYGTDWGRIAATISLRTLKELETYGCSSSSIFIPNIISMQEVVAYVEEAIDMGLDVQSRGVKLMIENAVSMSGHFIDIPYLEKLKGSIVFERLAPSLNEYRAELQERGLEVPFSMSYGFNDFTNSWKGRDGRHCDLPGCTLSDIYTYLSVAMFTAKAVKYGYDVTSCGMPEEGVMLAMVENGAKEIGVPAGLKAVNAAKLLCAFEEMLQKAENNHSDAYLMQKELVEESA